MSIICAFWRMQFTEDNGGAVCENMYNSAATADMADHNLLKSRPKFKALIK